eukprot:9140882-Alexandrium_andersonii.AAC.1
MSASLVGSEMCIRDSVSPAGAFNIRPSPDGSSWDFSKPADRDLVVRLLGARRPYLLAGSPPCTDWLAFNQNINHPRMDKDVARERLEKASVHMEFVNKRY